MGKKGVDKKVEEYKNSSVVALCSVTMDFSKIGQNRKQHFT